MTTQSLPYDDRLSRLLSLLTQELYGVDPGIWAWVTTRQCKVVALKVGEDGRRVLRISVEDRPSNVAAWDRFDAEIAVMLQHLGCSHWIPAKIDPACRASRVYQEPTLVERSQT